MITLKDAQKIVEGCLKKAREENMNPVTIAVLFLKSKVILSIIYSLANR